MLCTWRNCGRRSENFRIQNAWNQIRSKSIATLHPQQLHEKPTLNGARSEEAPNWMIDLPHSRAKIEWKIWRASEGDVA